MKVKQRALWNFTIVTVFLYIIVHAAVGLLIDVLLLYQGHRAIGETEASQKWL